MLFKKCIVLVASCDSSLTTKAEIFECLGMSKRAAVVKMFFNQNIILRVVTQMTQKIIMIIEAVENTASITSSDNESSRSSESNFLQPEVEVQVADQSECEIVKYRVFKRQYKNTRNITVGIDFWHSNCQYDTTVVLIFLFFF